MLAVFGDLGCSVGPWLAGVASDINTNTGLTSMDGLRFGLAVCTVFPLLMFILLRFKKLLNNKSE